LDYRFATSYCVNFLPAWITNGMKTLPNEKNVLGREISNFFKIQS
jgi:hypothetical protein